MVFIILSNNNDQEVLIIPLGHFMFMHTATLLAA
jgi:hypothetical protein